MPELLLMILIAAVVGAIGRQIAGGTRGGFLLSTLVGFLGTIIGPWLARELHLGEPLVVRVDGHAFPILWSIIGAAIFVAVVHAVSGPRWRRRRLA